MRTISRIVWRGVTELSTALTLAGWIAWAGAAVTGITFQAVTTWLGSSPLQGIAYGFVAGYLFFFGVLVYLAVRPETEIKRILGVLRKRREVGDKNIQIYLAATIWFGRQPNGDNEQLEWNYRLRLIKHAADEGRIDSLPHPAGTDASMHTKVTIDSLIRFFEAGNIPTL